MALNYIKVTGTYLKPDGVTPNAGYIEFRPNVPLAVSGAGVVFSEPLRAVLNSNGYFTINLMATDNPTVAPTGWLWFVDEKIEHGNQWYLATISKANGGNDPLDISYVFYPPGAAVNPPAVIKPGPAGIVGPPGKDATLYESIDEPIEGVSVGTYAELWVDTDETIDVSGVIVGNIEHSQLHGLAAGDDHPQYLKPDEILSGANITVDITTIPGSVIITGEAGGTGGNGGTGTGVTEVYAQPIAPSTVAATIIWVDTDDTNAAPTTVESWGKWSGTQIAYNALATKDDTVLYVISDTVPASSQGSWGRWTGTQAQYNAVTPKNSATLYVVI